MIYSALPSKWSVWGVSGQLWPEIQVMFVLIKMVYVESHRFIVPTTTAAGKSGRCKTGRCLPAEGHSAHMVHHANEAEEADAKGYGEDRKAAGQPWWMGGSRARNPCADGADKPARVRHSQPSAGADAKTTTATSTTSPSNAATPTSASFITCLATINHYYPLLIIINHY